MAISGSYSTILGATGFCTKLVSGTRGLDIPPEVILVYTFSPRLLTMLTILPG